MVFRRVFYLGGQVESLTAEHRVGFRGARIGIGERVAADVRPGDVRLRRVEVGRVVFGRARESETGYRRHGKVIVFVVRVSTPAGADAGAVRKQVDVLLPGVADRAVAVEVDDTGFAVVGLVAADEALVPHVPPQRAVVGRHQHF